MKLIFTDADGTKYYRNNSGSIVDMQGEIVTLTEEDNIRALIRWSVAGRRNCWKCGAPLTAEEGTLCADGVHRIAMPD